MSEQSRWRAATDCDRIYGSSTMFYKKNELPFRGANIEILKSIASNDDGESSNGQSENREKNPVDCYITELLTRARALIRDSLDKGTTYHQFCSCIIKTGLWFSENCQSEMFGSWWGHLLARFNQRPDEKKERSIFWGTFLDQYLTNYVFETD